MNKKKGINTKFINWLTFCALIVSLICLVVFEKGANTSGDTGIALWAIFLFSFTLVSAPLHFLLFTLTFIQSFIGSKTSLRWAYLYILISVVGHIFMAAKYGAFEDKSRQVMTLTSSEQLMHSALNTGTESDISKIQQALDAGVDPNSGLFQGSIPYLVKVASYADVPAIQMFLAVGANPNITTPGEHTPSRQVSILDASPLDVVMFAYHGDIIKSIEVLLDAGADPHNSFMKLGACRKGDMALFAYANSLDPNKLGDATHLEDANGKNCLHHAVEANQVAFLQQLLFNDQYADENAQLLLARGNKTRKLPLDLALILEHYEIAIMLIKAGAKANLQWYVNKTLENTANHPHLTELKTILRKELPIE